MQAGHALASIPRSTAGLCLALSLPLGLYLPGALWSLPAAAAAGLEAHFISVGQADATLIRCPDSQSYLLIDSADTRYPESSQRFRAYIQKEFEGKPKSIAVAVASHPHADHIGSMQWVLENFTVQTYVDNGEKFDSAMWARLDKVRKKQVKQGKLRYINGKQVRTAKIEYCPDAGVSLEIFVPWAFQSLSDSNDRSVVVRLTHRNVSFLFVGDAHDHAENVMLTQLDEGLRKKLDVQVLKVGHHGSDTSSTARFVMAVSPEIAIISSGEKGVGTNVRYKHPRFSTLDTYSIWFSNLDKGNSPPKHPQNGTIWAFDAARKTWRQHDRPRGLWLTTQDGTVVVQSDGNTLNVVLR